MEFCIPIPELNNLTIIGQFRFYSDRHMIVITDAESQSHGTLLQIDASIDDTIGTELNDIEAFAFEDGENSKNNTSKSRSESKNSKLPPIAVEITPLLGSERDNQWTLLVARRLTTVVAEALLTSQMGEQGNSTSVLSAPSPARNFSVSVVMMVHVPLAFKKSENMKYAMDVVKKLEGKVRETLMVGQQ